MAFKLKLELLLFVILEFIILILLAVGAPMPVMQSYDNSVQFTMWEERLIQNAQTTVISLTDLKDCDFTTEKLQAMAAFAMISIAFCLLGMVFTILDLLHRPTHRWATEAFGALVWGATLIVWPVGLSVFRTAMCGGSGFVPSDNQWVLKEAFILYTASWALLTFAVPAMWLIKLYIRPTYWSDPVVSTGGDIEQQHDAAETTVPVEALRRKKSKRSFIADRSHDDRNVVQKYADESA
ncbi:amastin, putative [Bodo saltans]|uniref:Amastin, putative n=1 Tax=Bodo saltans TaxID=75058 RepID=A0A0S4JGF4_BODSA|nr:amastin, putative [Bodo saltans]|eukprot:CUG89224.1 amastin, putative [Bodo saltans]